MNTYKCKNEKCNQISTAPQKPKVCPSCNKNKGFELVPDTSDKGIQGFQLGQAWTELQTRNQGAPIELLVLEDDALGRMTDMARALKIGSVKSQGGMTFNSGEWKDGTFTQGYFSKTPITKGSSGICYENMILPALIPPAPKFSNYLIHQSLAPCRLCRRGYSNWARDLQSTIVVAYDDAHDGLAANHALVFSPDQRIHYA
jgi:hypothetical protein